jgi:DNA-binding NarL/FixJ family response regulator
METQGLNLFIVDHNKSMLSGLKHYLTGKFGGQLKISTFCDSESCVNCINEETDVVILDSELGDENGNEILSSIKKRNPKTAIIMLSKNENMKAAIESFRVGAKKFASSKSTTWKKIKSFFTNITSKPYALLKEIKNK